MHELIVLTANYLLFVIGLVAAIYWARQIRATKTLLAVIGALGGAFTFLLVKIASFLYYDPRPFVAFHLQPYIQHAADNGFPSDHTALAALAAFVVYQTSRKLGTVLLVLTVILGASRVVALLHSPIDIAASLVIAGVSIACATLIAKRALRSKDERQ